MMAKIQDITGQRFGRLVVTARGKNTEGGRATWLCKCDCGGMKTVAAAELKKGNTRSCGCMAMEQRRRNAAAQSHDCSKSRRPRAKHAWENMIARCYKPHDRMYKNYGGRGIAVCEAWRNSFATFLADMGDPQPGMTLDRIDVNGNYMPENCRWTDRRTQANNRTNNRRLTIDGVTQTVAEWARQLGISCLVIHSRLYNGWAEHDAVMRPVVERASQV